LIRDFFENFLVKAISCAIFAHIYEISGLNDQRRQSQHRRKLSLRTISQLFDQLARAAAVLLPDLRSGVSCGAFFTLQGLWLVLPFSGLEMLALGIGLYVTSRRVYRREVITLDPECTRIEKVYSELTRYGNSRRRGYVWSTSVGVVEVRGARWLSACPGKASKWAVFLRIGKRMR
jgi:Integral membrane protein (DUF2244)